MNLVNVLNRCYRHPGFVYEAARFSPEVPDTIEVRLRARRGSRPYCSGCGRRCKGYDRLPERRFAFIPFWGFSVFFRKRSIDPNLARSTSPWYCVNTGRRDAQSLRIFQGRSAS